MSPKRKFWLIMIFVFLIVFCISGYVCFQAYISKNQAEEQLSSLAENTDYDISKETNDLETTEIEADEIVEVEEDKTEETSYLSQLGIEIPEKNIDFKELQSSTNQDIYAWIYIPETRIDFPIVQHPTDNEYYLNYNLDGSKGYPGCIYTENYNKKDFSDRQTVVYGHNMKDGSMFAGLHNYEDEKFFKEHPYVYIYTEDDVFVYQVFAAYKFSSIHLILGFNLENDELFTDYLNSILENREMGSVVDTDTVFDNESKIITLSTCVANVPNQRYLVQGVLIGEKEKKTN